MLLQTLGVMVALGTSAHIYKRSIEHSPTSFQGKVLVNNLPLESGSITIVTIGESQVVRQSQPITNGMYAFPDIFDSGKYIAEINAPRDIADDKIETIPAKYNVNSTLMIHLSPGSNFQDFYLTAD